MPDFEYSLNAGFSLSDKGGSSGNEADSEGEEIFDKDTKEMLSMVKTFNPYMYEPEREVSACSDESDVSDFDKSESGKCSKQIRIWNPFIVERMVNFKNARMTKFCEIG